MNFIPSNAERFFTRKEDQQPPAQKKRSTIPYSNVEKLKPSGTEMAQQQDLTTILQDCFKDVMIEASVKRTIIQAILLNIENYSSISHFQQRLDILYQHEKNYLNLIKEFKEEIKFISSMQEDIRKERARFFSDTLKEVTEALGSAKVSEDVTRQWLKDLVGTYTKSLDLSAGLIEEHTADTIGELKKQAQDIVNAMTASDPCNESSWTSSCLIGI